MNQRVDTCVIGGSAGSLTALKAFLPQLPRDLPMTLLLCQHTSITVESKIIDILSTFSPLPVRLAEDGMPLEPGCLFVAPPDLHMMVGDSHVHLRRGAHENNFRPAVDPLFRSAAIYRATRAVGLILSGLMDDGAAGARAISRTGGTVLVQSPDTAEFPDMPTAALAAVPEASSVPLDRLAEALVGLAGDHADRAPPIPWDIGIELKIAALEGANMQNESRLGELSPFNCPHCNDVLWEIEDGPLTRYRCHTGHAYTLEALNAEQENMLDRSLFESLRAHKGRAELLRRLSEKAGPQSREMLEKRADLVEEDAARLEEIISGRRKGQARGATDLS